MPRSLGVWLDRSRARIIDCSNGDSPTVELIESGVEPLRQSTGHIHNLPAGHGIGAVAHGSAERRRDQQLDRFYQILARRIKGVERLAILGPGPARDEFAAVVRNDQELAPALKAVEPVDARLTEAQIVARARELLRG
jgi:hypothetical protein